MKSLNTAIFPIVVVSSLVPHPSSLLRADSGTVRLHAQAGAYQVTVFTLPTPLRAGPVDISVLVQNATEECVPEAGVTIRLMPRETGEALVLPATTEAATNKLFRAADFELPVPGWWDVDVAIDGPYGSALVSFSFQADT